MKLTKRTIPQARDYQCDKCKAIRCHKDMVNDEICGDCYDKEQDASSTEQGVKEQK